MKVGDAVRFIGFEKYRDATSCNIVGIIVQVHQTDTGPAPLVRFSVLWPDGKIGQGLFAETLEVVSETR